MKTVAIAGVGTVNLYKHARSRSIRLSIDAHGSVRVSMPRWTPYAAGAAFARANADWIAREQSRQAPEPLESGQPVGKGRHIRFEHDLHGRTATSITADEVIIRLQPHETVASAAVQQRAQAAAQRALRREAAKLLPDRLSRLAASHGLSYKTVKIKSLKRRWGSCSSDRVITLNFYLMELPWQFIDYVLLHELTHTQKMHHGPEFWDFLTRLEPDARQLSKQLKRYQPHIGQRDFDRLVA